MIAYNKLCPALFVENNAVHLTSGSYFTNSDKSSVMESGLLLVVI